eukprot:m.67697 g.67697  ORF g.67697 m.67697 type:complete len:137 (-) comp8224_c1_seq2:64-474(-)
MGSVRTFFVLILSLMFLMAGSIKLYPFDESVHGMMMSKFIKYHSLFQLNDFGISSMDFQYVVGGLEVASALLLWVFPKFASFILFCVMGGAVATHVLLKDTPGEIAVPATFGLCFFLLLVIPTGQKESDAIAKKSQ